MPRPRQPPCRPLPTRTSYKGHQPSAACQSRTIRNQELLKVHGIEPFTLALASTFGSTPISQQSTCPNGFNENMNGPGPGPFFGDHHRPRRRPRRHLHLLIQALTQVPVGMCQPWVISTTKHHRSQRGAISTVALCLVRFEP